MKRMEASILPCALGGQLMHKFPSQTCCSPRMVKGKGLMSLSLILQWYMSSFFCYDQFSPRVGRTDES
uniref:Uncharacterized protein n=1 Tax=Rhizophora mucronata TaxID=61149 RepID=A0A2P2LBD2_RHIMU